MSDPKLYHGVIGTDMESAMTTTTIVQNWNKEKGFGFAIVGGVRHFVHATALMPRQARGADLNGISIVVEATEEVAGKGPRVTQALIPGAIDRLVLDGMDFSSMTKIDGLPDWATPERKLPQESGYRKPTWDAWVEEDKLTLRVSPSFSPQDVLRSIEGPMAKPYVEMVMNYFDGQINRIGEGKFWRRWLASNEWYVPSADGKLRKFLPGTPPVPWSD